MEDQIGIFHATLAQLFFSLVCVIALLTSKWWRNLNAPRGELVEPQSLKPNWLLPAITLLLLLQLILGATMRHQHAGLAIPDFPLAYGKVWPAMDAASVEHYNQLRHELTSANAITGLQIGLQMTHRLIALFICAAICFYAWLTRRHLGPRHPLARLAGFWLALIFVQAFLGAATIWSNKARHCDSSCAGWRTGISCGSNNAHRSVSCSAF